MSALSICPPVRAKFPSAELSLGGTAILNIAMLPFSDSCKIKVRLDPAVPTAVAVATAMLSKQLLPIVKFRLETLTDAVGDIPGVIVVGPSVMVKVKLSTGEGMLPVTLLIMVVVVALQVPVRLALVTVK